jgi:hypothetical protein
VHTEKEKNNEKLYSAGTHFIQPALLLAVLALHLARPLPMAKQKRISVTRKNLPDPQY